MLFYLNASHRVGYAWSAVVSAAVWEKPSALERAFRVTPLSDAVTKCPAMAGQFPDIAASQQSAQGVDDARYVASYGE